MKTEIFQINNPGPQTTIQDLGRYGFQNIGVPVSGAMDIFSFKAANILLNNPVNSACLETTFLGPSLTALNDSLISITGAKSIARINDKEIELWKPVEISKGDILSFEPSIDGIRNYLAIKGGIDVPLIMNSRSTYLIGKFGGEGGISLKTGHVIHSEIESHTSDFVRTSFLEGFDYINPSNPLELRILIGNASNKFSRESIALLWESTYKISSSSNRIGYRLNGPKINHLDNADIISSGNEFGAIQIPGDGHPIILMADRGTTGGYSKIGSVITPDLSQLAQAGPDHKITFRPVSLNEAQNIYLNNDHVLKSLTSRVTGQEKSIRVIYENQDYQINDINNKKITNSNKEADNSKIETQKYKVEYHGENYELDVQIYR